MFAKKILQERVTVISGSWKAEGWDGQKTTDRYRMRLPRRNNF
jgi:hypothetical protein